MKYLHKKDIIHRNLSIENILEDDNYYPKITGLNEIQFLETFTMESNDFVGYSKFAAPEVIEKRCLFIFYYYVYDYYK